MNPALPGLAKLAILSGTMPNGGATVTLAAAKTSLPFATAFVRGVLCNWLVCMAVYLASMAKVGGGRNLAGYRVMKGKASLQIVAS